jgi:hypothetical protein
MVGRRAEPVSDEAERNIERVETTPSVVAYFTHVRPRIANHAEQGCEAAWDRWCPAEPTACALHLRGIRTHHSLFA